MTAPNYLSVLAHSRQIAHLSTSAASPNQALEMGEVVNVLVAFAVIIFLLRWILSGEDLSSDTSRVRVRRW